MDKSSRCSIGIIFNFSKGWLGGFYYYQNIIKALNFLDDDEKPAIVIFYNREYAAYLKEIDYPYLQLVAREFPGVYQGYLKSLLTGKNVFVDEIIRDYKLQGIYPVNDNPVGAKKAIPAPTIGAAWFPDLQHKFFPQFFDKKRMWLRELRLKLTLRNASDLVVSSYDTVNHFKQFYSIRNTLKVHVLQFVSILDAYQLGDIEKIKAEYKIPAEYFIVSNAFLKHKNHLTVLKALNAIRQNGGQAHVVFTGKMDNYGGGLLINQLREYIAEHGLEQQVSLLGIIPREHQLTIMKHAKAVLQPSLFEGWNTTIEDAKSLQLPIIASAIAVHKEQLGEKGFYFQPTDENELAAVLANFSLNGVPVFYGDNTERIQAFARSFLKIFQPERYHSVGA
jgi:glycosyltransferase involved in cell wall biosynthesis